MRVGKGGRIVREVARRNCRRAHAIAATPRAWARRIEPVRHATIGAAFAHPTGSPQGDAKAAGRAIGITTLERLKITRIRRQPMALKYGRPIDAKIESKTRLRPV